MNVLKNPFPVILRAHAQVFLILLVPQLGKTVDVCIFLYHQFLYLIAHHHMETVGKLIGFCADQTRNCAVHSRKECIKAHRGEGLPKNLLNFPIDRLPEISVSPDNVLKKAGLGLMHSHGSPLADRRLCQVVADSQLIDCMARLMNHRENGRIDPIVIVGGDPHIMIVEICGKRMGADCHHAAAKVKAHIFCQKACRSLLLFLCVGACKKAVVNRFRALCGLF